MKPTTTEGEKPLGIAVATQGDQVILQFDQSIKWAALTPEAAQEVAGALVAHAKKCPSYKPLIITPV